MFTNLLVEVTGVNCIYEGASGMAAMLEGMIAVAKSDHLKKFKFIIHDLSRVTQFKHDDYALVMTAAQMEACIYTNPSIKMAIVSGDVEGDIAGQLLSEHLKRPMHVFQTPELAMIWAKSW